MKNIFPGYFKLTEDEIKELWRTGIFALDANILLNMYRYSDSTRDDFIKIFDSIQDRIWIPHQAAFEYLKNRPNVIGKQEKSYDEMIKSLRTLQNEKIQNILNNLKTKKRHPFISQSLLEKFTEIFEEIETELGKNKKKQMEKIQINDDKIRDRLSSLLEGKISPEYSKEDLDKIYKEGKERYRFKIPPGYEDEKDKPGYEKYGDLIIWKQIIDKSKKDGLGVILITDETKEDWWLKVNGRIISPRPELVTEFQKETKQYFYMYQAGRFMNFAIKYLDQKIKPNTLEEIREVRMKHEEELKRLLQLRDAGEKFEKYASELFAELGFFEEKLRKNLMIRRAIEVRLDDFQKNLHDFDLSKSEKERLRLDLRNKLTSLDIESKELEKKIEYIKYKIDERNKSSHIF